MICLLRLSWGEKGGRGGKLDPIKREKGKGIKENQTEKKNYKGFQGKRKKQKKKKFRRKEKGRKKKRIKKTDQSIRDS